MESFEIKSKDSPLTPLKTGLTSAEVLLNHQTDEQLESNVVRVSSESDPEPRVMLSFSEDRSVRVASSK